jgi:hypothetical protein
VKLFGRKDSGRAPARASQTHSNGERLISYRLTLELKRAENFATMLAKSRAARVIEVADLLAGMYICSWDRLSKYWEGGDEPAMEEFLRGICRISPQRWHSWMELYDRDLSQAARKRWLIPGRLKKDSSDEKPLRHSAALASVLKQAAKIAPAYDRSRDGSLPILTSECVLLCIVRSFGSEIARKLAVTGLDAEKLQNDALFPRRPPLGR